MTHGRSIFGGIGSMHPSVVSFLEKSLTFQLRNPSAVGADKVKLSNSGHFIQTYPSGKGFWREGYVLG